MADLNLDGLPDLVEVFYDAPVRLWRNEGANGSTPGAGAIAHWLDVKPGQPAPNVDAIGSWVEVRVGDGIARREVTIGGGHISGELGWQHFGLGSAASADVRVTWPDGTVGPWQPVTADQFVIVDRASGQVRPWTPAG